MKRAVLSTPCQPVPRDLAERRYKGPNGSELICASGLIGMMGKARNHEISKRANLTKQADFSTHLPVSAHQLAETPQ